MTPIVKNSLKMIRAEDIKLIDDYRDGKLTDKERHKIEHALKTDPELTYFLRLGEDCKRILKLFLQKPVLEENT